MPLFQNFFLKIYLPTKGSTRIHFAFALFHSQFANPIVRENISNSKEEQFRKDFFRELFVKNLGYPLNPDPEFNLTTKLKNIRKAKKTDGAIIHGGKNLVAIQPKGTDTKDLDNIHDHAFQYKNNHPDCYYVAISNFEKLRFHTHNAVDHQEFHMFQFCKTDFELLWLMLQKENLLARIPAKIKEESLLQEGQVTKRLYADYSSFKQGFWQDIGDKNLGIDEIQFKKAKSSSTAACLSSLPRIRDCCPNSKKLSLYRRRSGVSTEWSTTSSTEFMA